MGSCSGGNCFDAGFPKAARETKEVVSRLVRCWVMERPCVIPTICLGLPKLFDMLQWLLVRLETYTLSRRDRHSMPAITL